MLTHEVQLVAVAKIDSDGRSARLRDVPVVLPLICGTTEPWA